MSYNSNNIFYNSNIISYSSKNIRYNSNSSSYTSNIKSNISNRDGKRGRLAVRADRRRPTVGAFLEPALLGARGRGTGEQHSVRPVAHTVVGSL